MQLETGLTAQLQAASTAQAEPTDSKKPQADHLEAASAAGEDMEIEDDEAEAARLKAEEEEAAEAARLKVEEKEAAEVARLKAEEEAAKPAAEDEEGMRQRTSNRGAEPLLLPSDTTTSADHDSKEGSKEKKSRMCPCCTIL